MTIVAHNAAFDISFVKKMFNDYENQTEIIYDNVFSRNAIDTATMALILRLQGKLPFDRCSLDNILTFYDIDTANKTRHTALYDCTQTAQAFLCMFDDLSNTKKRVLNQEHKSYDSDFNDLKKYLLQGGAEREL